MQRIGEARTPKIDNEARYSKRAERADAQHPVHSTVGVLADTQIRPNGRRV